MSPTDLKAHHKLLQHPAGGQHQDKPCNRHTHELSLPQDVAANCVQRREPPHLPRAGRQGHHMINLFIHGSHIFQMLVVWQLGGPSEAQSGGGRLTQMLPARKVHYETRLFSGVFGFLKIFTLIPILNQGL